MYLTRFEEKLLEGEEGLGIQKSMELLVALGDVFGANRLVPVESAHISGVSYMNLGKGGLDWLEEQVTMGIRCQIRATLNPAGMDMQLWKEMGVPEKFAEGQKRIIQAFKQMGVETTCTCTPYLIGHIPKRGSQVAWAESNAVCFVNSVIGARTNRESGPTTLASANTGLTPLYGYRLNENRMPKKVIEVEANPKSHLDYSALGYVTGKIIGNDIPYFKGLGDIDVESMKTLGAACATSGGIALWHGENITPEAKEATKHIKDLENITIEKRDLDEARSMITSNPDNPTYCIGCPHCSLKEIDEISSMVEGGNLGGRLWIFTSRGVYAKAEKNGYVKTINAAGGKIYRDTCMVVAPLKEMGWEGVATNSFKGGHYCMAHGFSTKLATVQELIQEALK